MARKTTIPPLFKKLGIQPPPQCKAILLSDIAIVDVRTKKPSIVGVFDRFVLPDLPGTSPACSLFLQFVRGIGIYAIAVEIHDLRKNVVLAKATVAAIEFETPMSAINVQVPVPPLRLAYSGAYDIVVFANGDAIDTAQFHVQTIKEA